MSGASDTAARELMQRYAERAMRAVVALARNAKSPRVRVSAAKTVLRGATGLADKKVAIDALVEVMDTGKAEGERLSAAKEILRVSRREPVDKAGAGAREREARPLPPALAKLLVRSPAAPIGAGWQQGTALTSGTVRLPR